ncbi:chorismate-binding protein [Actinomadura sp. HBU206391]|uniref:chorismate-binding protein n=1 Tax=Actinomadura sp. HBU206391 TaxID=2731692 RepID=UPI00164F10C1|nr:chorismate-binding protein [Actinomadura sp. HBU206391]MBC6460761.1 chorismate-binding protein [Actinomadura sp. HBU206391]
MTASTLEIARAHAGVTADPAAGLLDRYSPGDCFFFASARYTLLAQGVFAAIPAGDRGTLPGRAAQALRDAEAAGHPRPVIVGTLPLDPGMPTWLVIPARVHWAAPLRPGPPPNRIPVAHAAIRDVPGPAAFRAGIESALTRLDAGELDEITLTRALHLAGLTGTDQRELLRNLGRNDPCAHLYATDLPVNRTLLGSGPVPLVRRTGDRILVQALGDSTGRGADPATDRRLAAALIGSAVGRRRHALTVDAAAAALTPHCGELDVPGQPSLICTPTRWHLSTRLSGRLIDPTVSSLALATALRPAPPGRGGSADGRVVEPTGPFGRNFHRSAVGWCDASGDGEWVVAGACAEIGADQMRLFTGTHVVAGTDPDTELADTSARLRTLLTALGVDRQA